MDARDTARSLKLNGFESMIKFELPIITPSNNVWARTHYRVRRKICADFAILVASAIGIGHKPIEKCVITITRYSSGQLDWDNLYGGFKPLLDALVAQTKTNPHGTGVILDDNPNVVIELIGKQVKCKRIDSKTIIEIDEIKQ